MNLQDERPPTAPLVRDLRKDYNIPCTAHVFRDAECGKGPAECSSAQYLAVFDGLSSEFAFIACNGIVMRTVNFSTSPEHLI